MVQLNIIQVNISLTQTSILVHPTKGVYTSPDVRAAADLIAPRRNGFLALLHRTIHGLVDLPEDGWWEEAQRVAPLGTGP